MKLPVSGWTASFRAPNGNDDLCLLEARGSAVERAAAVLLRLAKVIDSSGTAREWEGLTITDFECGLMGLRQFLLGDSLECLFRCGAAGCGERMEVSLSISAFLGEIQPRVAKNVVESTAKSGYFACSRWRFSLRPVTLADLLSVQGLPEARKRLRERTVVVEGTPGEQRYRGAERAMEFMAPAVSREVSGHCPVCGAEAAMLLHVPTVVMDELQAVAAGVYRETHWIAEAYHWPEADILALPAERRQAYAEMIRRVAA